MWAIILATVLAGILVLIIIAFCIPVDMTFRVERYGRLQNRVRISWLFGLVCRELGDRKRVSATIKPKKRPTLRILIEILKTPGFIKKLTVLLKKSIKIIRIKELSSHLRIGFDDAADTGILFSILGPAVALVNYFPHCSVRLEPSFMDEAVFEGYFNGEIRLQPIRLAPPFTSFIFSMPTLKVIKILLLHK
ncbi:MAG: DUF2953 domain-containing protein [Dehalococcoidales bacterium]|nr:DUF2953 domain-containing protein [Dehalococcoidales bacterium]